MSVPILKIYVLATVVSFLVLFERTGDPFAALFFCGWIGLATAVLLNELTGY